MTRPQTRKARKATLAALMEKPDLNGLDVARIWMENDLYFEKKKKVLYQMPDLLDLLQKLREGPKDIVGGSLEEARLEAIMGVYERAKVSLKNFNTLRFAFGQDTFQLLASIKGHGLRLISQMDNTELKGLKEWLETGKDLEEDFEEVFDLRKESYESMKGYLEVYQAIADKFGVDHFLKQAQLMFNDVERTRDIFTREINFVLANFPSLGELDQRTHYLTGSKLEDAKARKTKSFEEEKALILKLAEI